MKIDGPLKLNVIEDDVEQIRTLEITFKSEFQRLTLEQRTLEFKQYIQSLYQTAQMLNEVPTEKTGLELIMQMCEELLPFIQQDELELQETIRLDMAMKSSREG